MRPSDVSFLTMRFLSCGRYVGFDFLDAKLAGNRLGGRLVVAGQHHDPYAVVPKSIEGRLRRRLDRVGNGDDAAWFVVDCEKQGGRAVAAKLVGPSVEIAEFYAEVSHQLGIAQRHGPAIDLAGDALAGDRGEVRRLLGRHSAIFRSHDDGGG